MSDPYNPTKPKGLPGLQLVPPSLPKHLIRGQEVSVYYNLRQSGSWPKHRRNQVEIALLFSAKICRLSWAGPGSSWHECELRGQNVCVIPANLVHACDLEGEAELLVLYVENHPIGPTTPLKTNAVLVVERAECDVVVWILACLLRHLCTRPLRPTMRTIDALGGELASWLIGLLRDSGSVAPEFGRCLTPVQREKVMRFIQANLKYDIHVVDLAKQTDLSLSHFTELFVNSTGHSPYHYLKQARFIKAYEMLLTGDYLVKEAALAVGYSDADHFAEVFSNFCGYNPRELLTRVRLGLVSSPVSSAEHREG